MVYELWVNSKLASERISALDFFWSSAWDPVFDHFGALPFIYGTIVTAIVSLVIAVPLGLGRRDLPRRTGAHAELSDTTAFLIDLLAAVPSVIYGLLGIFVVVPLMRTTIGPALKAHSWVSCRSSKAPITASAC